MRVVNLFVVFVILALSRCSCLASEPTASTTSSAAIQRELDDVLRDSRLGHLKGCVDFIRKSARDPKVSYDRFAAEYDCLFGVMGYTIVTLKELGTSQEELVRLLQSRRKITPAHERKKAWMRDRMVDSFLFRGKWK